MYPLLIFTRGLSVTRFETAGKIGRRTKSGRIRRIACRRPFMQLLRRLAQSKITQIIRRRQVGERLQFALKLALTQSNVFGRRAGREFGVCV